MLTDALYIATGKGHEKVSNVFHSDIREIADRVDKAAQQEQ